MEVLYTNVQQAREWIDQHPDFNRAFLPYLGKQMHGLADQVIDLSLFDTEARLARLILRYLAPGKSPQEVHLINDLRFRLAATLGRTELIPARSARKVSKTPLSSLTYVISSPFPRLGLAHPWHRFDDEGFTYRGTYSNW